MKKNHRMAYGLKLLSGNHRALRQLKRQVRPLEHGHKVWSSSWLLIDYLLKKGTLSGSRVLDLGCGWGMTGIFCAKKFNTEVTWCDIDGAVYPYLSLMAETNGVSVVNFLNLGIEEIRRSVLRKIDVIVASDICFCDSLIDPLRRLINRAKAASVKQIMISDPGRWPFDDLAELFQNKAGVGLIPWESHQPIELSGKILNINFNSDH